MIGIVRWLMMLVLRLIFAVVFYGTPVLGFWLASSLAAYLGEPGWIAWAAGLAMFPIIPGAWEFQAWAHQDSDKKPWFNPLERFSLRTFGIGLIFIIGMLCAYPQTAFVALSTRGDWMLDGVKDPRAKQIRPVLFAAAGALESLYRSTRTNPNKEHIDEQARKLSDEATKQRAQEVALQQEKAAQGGDLDQQGGTASDQNRQQSDQSENRTDQQTGDAASSKTSKEPTSVAELKWPWTGAALHPLVANMPASVETSINSVARYIAKHETDPILRVKALHDYVADRVSYDADAFFSNNYPPQDAQTVFQTHKSVCAGYANLLSALAKASGDKIIVVEGDARPDDGSQDLTGCGHAWNAARINNQWYLIDSCWDSGYVSREKGFTKHYKTEYFLPPPEVMIQDHFPDDKNWQMLAKPLSQGDFLRQPMLKPSFYAANLKLVTPQRACVETETEAMAIVKNPRKEWIMADLKKGGTPVGDARPVTNTETAQMIFPLPDNGKYSLNMYVSDQQYGEYDYIGAIDFIKR